MNDFLALFFFVGFCGLLFKHYIYPWYRSGFVDDETPDLENMTAVDLLTWACNRIYTTNKTIALQLPTDEEDIILLMEVVTLDEFDEMNEDKTVH